MISDFWLYKKFGGDLELHNTSRGEGVLIAYSFVAQGVVGLPTSVTVFHSFVLSKIIDGSIVFHYPQK